MRRVIANAHTLSKANIGGAVIPFIRPDELGSDWTIEITPLYVSQKIVIAL